MLNGNIDTTINMIQECFVTFNGQLNFHMTKTNMTIKIHCDMMIELPQCIDGLVQHTGGSSLVQNHQLQLTTGES